MTDTQRPQRPKRAVPVRPGFEPDDGSSDDLSLPPARKRPAPKKPVGAKKAAPRKTSARTTSSSAKPAAKRTTKRAPAKTAPARSRAPQSTRRPTPAPAPDVDFTYDDAPRGPVRPSPAAALADAGIVRANLDVHLAMDDEPWWTFPDVCVKTGEPTTATITNVASGAPKWSYLSFLLGVLPGYLIVRTVFPAATLKLPFSERIRNRRRVAMTIASVLTFGGFAGMATAGFTENDTLGGLAFLAFLAGLVAVLIAARIGRTKVRIVNREVVIPRVHPAFAAAMSLQPTADEQRAAFENTSGAGKAALVPLAVKRWNWGAFVLAPIWAIGNSVWIGLLGFVPFVNFVMSFVLAIKGNEWAWRKKRWPSPENFLTTQRHWAGASAALLAGTVVLSIIYSFAGYEPVLAPDGYGTTSTTIADYADGKGGVRTGERYGFVATFPSTPRHEAVTQEAAGFDVPIDLLTSESSDSAFQVGAVNYPNAIDVSDPRGLLHAAAQGSAGAITGGKLVRYTETTVDGDPAAGILISGTNGVFARQRFVLHGHTLFTIQVVSTSENPPGFGRFVASFSALSAIDIDAPAE